MLFFSSLKSFYQRSFQGKPDYSTDTGIRLSDPEYRNKKITELEQEFHDLMTSWPPNVSRLSQIVSELGRLWNTKLRDEEEKKPLVEGDGLKDMSQLQMAVDAIIREGKQKMGSARNKEEINSAFVESVNKMICLLE
jgi:hypothetical protein